MLRSGQVQCPSPGAAEVLIRVRATSVNTPDWATVAGVPSILRLGTGLRRPGHPVRGTDVAGVVEATGSQVTDLRPGDEVFGSLWGSTARTHGGAFAEYTVAPGSQVARKPAALSFTDAAASAMTGLTALIAMRDAGQVGDGSHVLVNGASGGVGTMSRSRRRWAPGSPGVCGPRTVELVRSIGAARVIDYTTEDFTRDRQRYDVILDNVLNRPPSATARLLAPRGVLIPNSIGNTGGLLAGLPRVARAMLTGLGSTTLDAAATAVAHMLGHHARGKVAITVP